MFAPDGRANGMRIDKRAAGIAGGAFPFCLELNDTNCINNMNYAFPEQPRTYFILCATTSLIAARAGVRYCRGSK